MVFPLPYYIIEPFLSFDSKLKKCVLKIILFRDTSVIQSTDVCIKIIYKNNSMKKANLILTGLAISFITIYGCKKENFDSLAGSTSSNNLSDGSFERRGQEGKGAVYIMDNAVSGNNIVMYDRDNDGQLTPSGIFPTGGTGKGSGLGSQGSLIIEGDYLFACNPGSNEISVLKTTKSGLTLIHKVSSNGMNPVSVTVHDDLLYVLNSGGTGNISGFRIMPNFHLNYIQNSARTLSSSSAGAAQVEFNHSGNQLVVTEKATNNILTYEVDNSGLTGNAIVHASVGATPFGFEFGKNNVLIVSDAFGGAAGQSALTSYSLNNNGNINLITGPVATTQTAACWVVVTKDGKYCYTTNTGSGNVSGYNIGNNGELSLLDANGITGITGAGPIDMSLSKNSKFLYTLNGAGHSISMFRVNNNGSLMFLGDIPGLLVGSVGMAAE